MLTDAGLTRSFTKSTNPDRCAQSELFGHMPPRPLLRALAAHIGILPSYVDQFGRVRRASDRSRIAVLGELGIEAATEAAARAALSSLQAQMRAQRLAPVRVAGVAAARTLTVRGVRGARHWSVEIVTEDGAPVRAVGRVHGAAQLSVRLPSLPLGYHHVRVTLDGPDGELVATQRLIVVPPCCPTPRARLGAERAYGLLANLYTLRSRRNWGIGDLSDLSRLVEWAGDIGAAFVGINPLHALDNRGEGISPYSPLSRLYRNVLYLDVTAAPEWQSLPDSLRRRLARSEAVRGGEHVDYAAIRALKQPAFTVLHRAFSAQQRAGATTRGRAYARYIAVQGDALQHFATFLALQEHFERRGITSSRRWPAAFRDPRASAVAAFRAEAREVIDRHCFLQFELERQLGKVAATARAHGLPIGVYQDLALGSSPDGSDAWSFPQLFLRGLAVGAPPDDYSSNGQNWCLPPIDPRRLAATGYEYWIRLLRAALCHAGALRIDHVLGLVRQYWIPAGMSGAEGVYVRFPAADLFGILALESHRAGALVIGEDLGTVPRGLPALLARWGVLSTRVLYFERTRGGGFRAASAYRARALAGANTHDLVPLAGFLDGADLRLRHRLGLLRGTNALARAQAGRERERRALVWRLRRDGVLANDVRPTDLDVRAAVHAFLGRTPAALVGVSLDDLAGETTPVNLPGVPIARYPSWSRRFSLSLESFAADPGVARALNGLPFGARRARTRRGKTGFSPR